jgi:predicted negative regulator of RcsB-dependent stress response
MANNLDLEEQEQLEDLKHFWRKYGNLITWTVVLVLAAYAAWNGWNWWQRDQGLKAAGMYEELDRAAGEGDAERAGRVFADLRDRFGGTAFAGQGGLLAARVQLDKGQGAQAQQALGWVADNAREDEYRAIARLRLAALLLDEKKYDEALKRLDGDMPKAFAALAADRRGDVLHAQGKDAEAVKAYEQAYKALAETDDYRRLVEAKLVALGAGPGAAAADAQPDATAGATAAASAASGASK